MATLSNTANATAYKGNDRVLFGFILGLLSFWLFGMTMLNINVVMNQDLGLPTSSLSLAVSITALFSGMTVVVFGGLADKIGRVKITRLGFIFAIVGAALIAIVPGKSGLTLPVLLTGRILQGLSAACIMPATLALLREYWDEKGRQRAVSLWSMGTWGGTSFAALVGGAMADNLGWRWIFVLSTVLSVLGLFLIRDLPESKAEQKGKTQLDYLGMLLFMFFIVTL
ncbi:MAG TPA: MFS transporter [Bacteroidales bacterium]|nr:MFS transporter [Bacteroidales bacterium]HPK29544.1 MFS transporter [Bacteroidales bacterium]